MKKLTEKQARKRVKKVLELNKTKYGFSYVGYKDLSRIIGQIVVHKSIGDYQGDTLILFYNKKEKMYGVLNFGWGSCSGCDALEGCEDLDDHVNLFLHLQDSTKWMSSDELINWLDSPARENDVFHFIDKWGVKSFIKMCKNAVCKRIARGDHK